VWPGRQHCRDFPKPGPVHGVCPLHQALLKLLLRLRSRPQQPNRQSQCPQCYNKNLTLHSCILHIVNPRSACQVTTQGALSKPCAEPARACARACSSNCNRPPSALAGTKLERTALLRRLPMLDAAPVSTRAGLGGGGGGSNFSCMRSCGCVTCNRPAEGVTQQQHHRSQHVHIPPNPGCGELCTSCQVHALGACETGALPNGSHHAILREGTALCTVQAECCAEERQQQHQRREWCCCCHTSPCLTTHPQCVSKQARWRGLVLPAACIGCL
jgi:hypothetical protein